MPKKKSPKSVRIRNSTAEFLTFAYQTGGDGVQVRVQDGMVWLSQKNIGQIFDTTPENVLMHLKNIYAENEISESATTKDFLAVQTEGKRQVQRNIQHYNLEGGVELSTLCRQFKMPKTFVKRIQGNNNA